MSKRIETSIIINKPLDAVWQEVKVMENHVNWMEDAVKIDILSENNSGIDTKMNVLTKVGPVKLTDIITVTEWKEKESIGVIHEGIVTGEGIFYLTALNESQTEFRWEETLKFPIYLGGVIGEFFGSYVLKYIWKIFHNFKKINLPLKVVLLIILTKWLKEILLFCFQKKLKLVR